MSLTMISLGPSTVQVKVGSLVRGTPRTNANDTPIHLVKVPIMNVLLSLPSQARLREKQRQSGAIVYRAHRER